MRRRRLVNVLLLGVLLTLSPCAYASPPDPTWIPGFYDDADYDDVILLVLGAVTTIESRIVDPIGVVAVCLGTIAPSTPRSAWGHPFASPSPRAPPSQFA